MTSSLVYVYPNPVICLKLIKSIYTTHFSPDYNDSLGYSLRQSIVEATLAESVWDTRELG